MTETPPPGRIEAVQALRGVAAFLVVLYHAGRQFGPDGGVILFDAGRFGVDVFFVISAFVMIVATQRGTPPLLFLKHRALRIVPLYWLATCLAALILVAAPTAMLYTGVSLHSFLLSLAFIPHSNPGNPGVPTPVFTIGWTLNFEMYFYLCLAIGLALSHRHRALIAGGIVMGFVIARNAGLASTTVLDFIGSEIALEFVFGMILARLWLTGRLPVLPIRLGLPLLILSLCAPFALAPLDLPDLVLHGSAALLCLWSALSLEPLANRRTAAPLITVGAASYSLYLSHIFTLIALGLAWSALAAPTTGLSATLAFTLTACILSVAVALAVYHWIEAPIMRITRKPIR